MALPTIILIALALAMDAFAVAIAAGVALHRFHTRNDLTIGLMRFHIQHAVTVALWFGAFQALMPLAGWFGGVALSETIGRISHWIAFGLLTFVGGKMIFEAFKIEDAEERSGLLSTYMLFILAIATSIDALAVGFSFAMVGVAILLPVLIIGGITFFVCALGVWIGDRGGHFFEKKIEIGAGLLLIGIGVKILLSKLL